MVAASNFFYTVFGMGTVRVACKKKRCITSKWIHRLAQDFVERFVMSQRIADSQWGGQSGL